MRLTAIIALLLFAASAHGQFFAGLNGGPAYGRTLDGMVMLYPKNEDWIAFTASGGYTFRGPLYFPRKADCVDNFKHGGWHMRLGARNGLTTDDFSNHIFWGLEAVYSRQIESATINACDDPRSRNQRVTVLSGSFNVGYTWNPFRKRTIYQYILVDFGLRASYPFWTNQPLYGERDYISGVGYTWLPIRSIAFEPMVALRVMLFKSRYGFSRFKEGKRFFD